jgi:hypothetical protein
MGLFSNPLKAVKNVFKGVTKVFKRAFSAVKQFVKSDLGKMLITAAVIYFGGAALGAWGAGTTAGVAAPIAEAATVAGAAAPATATPTVFGAGLLDAAPAAAEGIASASATAIPAEFGAGLLDAAPAAAESTGLISQLKGGAKAYEAWAKANPLTSKLVGGALVAIAASPDPNQALDVEKWRRGNMNVAGVDVEGTGVGALNLPQLKRTTNYVDAQPGGVVSRPNRST